MSRFLNQGSEIGYKNGISDEKRYLVTTLLFDVHFRVHSGA